MPTKIKKTKKRKSNTEVYQGVTDRVVAALEAGTVPWQSGWTPQGGFFKNVASKKAYRGINVLLLMIASLENGYTSPYWLTFKQAKEKGGTVKQGETSTKIVFMSMVTGKNMITNPKTGKEEKETFWLMREWSVFNLEQCEGIDPKHTPAPPKENKLSASRKAEALLKAMPKPAKVLHYTDVTPSYSPILDRIAMPKKGQFKNREVYYATLFHETVHSTGHSSRLALKNIEDYEELKGHVFGSEDYSEEELRAELGASMLAALVGLDTTKVQERSAAYLHNWISRLKAEPKLIYAAAQKAQKACDYITGEKPKETK